MLAAKIAGAGSTNCSGPRVSHFEALAQRRRRPVLLPRSGDTGGTLGWLLHTRAVILPLLAVGISMLSVSASGRDVGESTRATQLDLPGYCQLPGAA